MALPAYAQHIKARLAANPLYFVGKSHHVSCLAHMPIGARGRKVSLSAACDYGDEFSTCPRCAGVMPERGDVEAIREEAQARS